jgi:hypothetical protein
MAGEQIALTRLLRLRDALKSTINSKEFIFVMCRALYSPMRVLRLADQQVPGMENYTITFYRQIRYYSGGCLMQR